MPLQQLREQQKIIFWIVTILIIPSFVLLWGVGGYATVNQEQPAIRCVINGQPVNDNEVYKFQQRMSAVIGSVQIMRAGMYGPQGMPIETSTAILMALAKEGERAGIMIPETAIGTFIRNHRVLGAHANEGQKTLDDAFKRFLKDERLTTSEFFQGVREWLTILRFADTLDRQTLVTDQTAYALHIQKQVQFTYQTLEIRVTDKMREEAGNRLLGITPEIPEGNVEAAYQQMEQHLSQNAASRRYWSPAKWTFEYMLAPFDAWTPELTEDELRAQYETLKETRYAEKSFDEVREEILDDRTKEQRERYAEATAKGFFQEYLVDAIKSDTPVTLENIQRDADLSQRGVITGTSGETTITTDEIAQIEALGGSRQLKQFLDGIDLMDDIAKRTERVKKLQEHFDVEQNPLRCGKGFLRIRIREYQPSAPRRLRLPDGTVDAGLRVLLEADLMEKYAMEIAEAEAKNYMEKIRAKQTADFADRFKSETVTFYNFPQDLQDRAPNDPVLARMRSGWKILNLVHAKVPSLESFRSLSAEEKTKLERGALREQRGVMQPLFGRWILIPGPRMEQWIVDAEMSQRLIIYALKDNAQ